MKNIPEGATHTAPDGTYRMLLGGYWRQYAGGDWVIVKSPCTHLYTHIKDEVIDLKATKVVEWDGEGDPPVGIECEWFPTAAGRVKVKILGRDGSDTWYRVLGEEHPKTCRHMAFLRPVRTAEQIAADEREHKIRNACTSISKTLDRFNNDIPGGGAALSVIEAMIDAGYAKQVEK